MWTWRWTKFLSVEAKAGQTKSAGEVAQAYYFPPSARGETFPATGRKRTKTPAKIAIDGARDGWPINQLFLSSPFVHDRHMAIEIKIRKNEPIDRALRRMKKKLDRENIIKGTRAKRYYEKPCERRRRKEKVQAFTQMLRRRYAE